MIRHILIAIASFVLLISAQPAEAQRDGKVHRIGYKSNRLGIGPREQEMRRGLRELGYVEGRNLVIEWRFTKGDRRRLDDFAAELVRLGVECIVSSGTGTTRAVKKATDTIPVVMANIGDPLRTGLVSNLARPGGNVTGFTTMTPNLAGKQLEVLRDAFPHVARISVLLEPANPSTEIYAKDIVTAAASLGMKARIWEMRQPDDFAAPFRDAAEGGADALIVVATSLLFNNRDRIFALQAETRLPVVFTAQRLVRAGGLMSYGPSRVAPYRRVAVYVDRILRGAKPGDLPVERPTRFELVLNLRTARALGITFPPAVLLRADRIIE